MIKKLGIIIISAFLALSALYVFYDPFYMFVLKKSAQVLGPVQNDFLSKKNAMKLRQENFKLLTEGVGKRPLHTPIYLKDDQTLEEIIFNVDHLNLRVYDQREPGYKVKISLPRNHGNQHLYAQISPNQESPQLLTVQNLRHSFFSKFNADKVYIELHVNDKTKIKINSNQLKADFSKYKSDLKNIFIKSYLTDVWWTHSHQNHFNPKSLSQKEVLEELKDFSTPSFSQFNSSISAMVTGSPVDW